MKRFVFEPDGHSNIARLISGRLRSEFEGTFEPERAETLVTQGSVYQAKRRIKDPEEVPRPSGGNIEIFYPELPVTPFSLDPRRIAFEDDDILVADKPAGVNAAPSPFSDVDCMTWGVERYLRQNGVTDYRVSAVHRLDRDTQGLMLFAKHKTAELGLHALFREHRVRKIYEAFCPVFETSPLGPRRRVYRIRDVLDWRGKAQDAVTTVLASDRAAETSPGGSRLLRWVVLPHTGRPHQIRKHFAAYLVPIYGDRVYAGEAAPDLGLACVAYRFGHPLSGEPMRVERRCESYAADVPGYML